jgi:hypothetical protein
VFLFFVFLPHRNKRRGDECIRMDDGLTHDAVLCAARGGLVHVLRLCTSELFGKGTGGCRLGVKPMPPQLSICDDKSNRPPCDRKKPQSQAWECGCFLPRIMQWAVGR